MAGFRVLVSWLLTEPNAARVEQWTHTLTLTKKSTSPENNFFRTITALIHRTLVHQLKTNPYKGQRIKRSKKLTTSC